MYEYVSLYLNVFYILRPINMYHEFRKMRPSWRISKRTNFTECAPVVIHIYGA